MAASAQAVTPKGRFELVVSYSGKEPSRNSNLLLSSIYFQEILEVVLYLGKVGIELRSISVVLVGCRDLDLASDTSRA